MTDFSKLPLLNKLSPRQYEVLAYLAVGGWNTLFGIGLYALVYRLFGGRVHYLLLAVPVNVAAITNAFLCYKLFVFRTKGRWLREYLRCYLVYGSGTLAGMGLLWLFAGVFGMSPVYANTLGTAIVVVASYFGHKYFSFARPQDPPGEPRRS